MQRFKNILLVLNPDVEGTAAQDKAVSLARQNKARLTVFSVIKGIPGDMSMALIAVTPEELFESIVKKRRKMLNALVTDIRKQGVEAKSMVVPGTPLPFMEIIRQVLRDKHDLVILAAEGKGGIKQRLFGSTSMHLMRKCPCPVWVVKSTHVRPYTRILAAVDPTGYDQKNDSLNPLILQLASSIARKDAGDLHIMHAWRLFRERDMRKHGVTEKDIQEAKAQEKTQHKQRLDNLLSWLDVTDLKLHLHFVEGDAEVCLPELVVAQDIDLLIMGTVCRTGIAGLLIGNTAEEVLNQVDCSVLTVKPEGFVTPVTLEVE